MTRLIGFWSIAFALGLAVYGLVAAVIGAQRGRRELVRSAEAATYANFGLLFVANLAMVYALVTRDFSISYVAQVGSWSTPLFFTVISLWSSLEGSILFWGLVLATYAAGAIWVNRRFEGKLLPYTIATFLGVQIFFFILLVGPANPFGSVFPVPADGPGPNPLLQNHILMAIHPPFLYLGYVGLTVPFAFAMGALLSGRLDDTWIRMSRRWTIVAWSSLSLAIMMGMWWSYEVLGWGGYWAWDPVENASFLPWLTATAFLHSVMVQERRGMLKLWNMTLVVSTFLLTVLGTFLTRSGVISSVHAFTEGPIGLYFMAFMTVTLLFSVAVLVGRSGELASDGQLDSAASRETVFLINNLLLTAFTFTVLLGTLFPLVAEAIRGVKVSVGAPFFNRMTTPLMVALLFLVGVGPALPWRRADMERLKTRFLAPFAGMMVGLVLALITRTPSVWAILAFAFAGFALVSNLQEFWEVMRARMRVHGEFAPVALARGMASNRRRYGGYTAHIGLIVMAIGITASSVFKVEKEMTLAPGEAMEIGAYQVVLNRIYGEDEPQRFVVGAELQVFKDGRPAGQLTPRLNYYRMSDQPITTPDVRERPDEDLYLTLMAFERDGSSATLRAVIEPLVVWIWFGGLVIGFGAVFGILPTRRRAPAFATAAQPLPQPEPAAPLEEPAVAAGGGR